MHDGALALCGLRARNRGSGPGRDGWDQRAAASKCRVFVNKSEGRLNS
jgi:hypothetical protein